MTRNVPSAPTQAYQTTLPTLAALALSLTIWTSPATAERYALTVGIDHYSSTYGAGSLPSCVNDATGFKDALLRDGALWSADNIGFLTDAQATKSNIRETLEQIARLAGPGDVCVFFQSSHGGQYGETSTFLCTHDADYSDQELGQDLAGFDPQATVIVIVDACHSGGLFKDDSGKPIAAPAAWTFAENTMVAFHKTKAAAAVIMGEDLPKDIGSNVGFITACDYDQTCSAGNPYSLFAGYLLRAFAEAGADSNRDGAASFWELYSWAAPQATERNSSQTAQSYNQGVLSNTIAAGAGTGTGGSDSTRRPDNGDDHYEENDSMQSAVALPNGVHQLVGRDEDWFKVTCQPGRYSITVTGSEGDLDLFILDREGNRVGVSNGYSSNESLEGMAEEPTEAYLLVAPYQGQGGSYTLTLNAPGNSSGNFGGDALCLCGNCAGLPLLASAIGMLGLGRSGLRRRC